MNINQLLKQPKYKGYTKYGAQMGRRNNFGESPQKLYLQKLKFIDGDYDTGGAYWGSGGYGEHAHSMYCAFSKDETVMIFMRARNRAHAATVVKSYNHTLYRDSPFIPNSD